MGSSSLAEAWLWLQLTDIGIPYMSEASSSFNGVLSVELVPYGELS